MNLNDQEDELLVFAIKYIREKFHSLAKELVVQRHIDYFEELTITIPQRGDKKHLLDLAEKNLKYYMIQKRKKILIK